MSRLKHGWYGTPEYQAWQDMKRRCYDLKRKSFIHYGGRGIKVCDRWLTSFVNFIADMGPRPSSKFSLDRIKNNGDYTPKNCRWSTGKDQQRNKRCNRIIRFDGVSRPQIYWLEIYKLPKTTFTNRLKRGWSLRRALTEPCVKTKNNKK